MALDLSSRLVSLGLFGVGYDERGFLGFTFHPDYQSNGKLYTYTSEPVNGPADFSTIELGQNADHQNVVIEWTVPDPSKLPDPTSNPAGNPRVLLRLDWPQFNHDGGTLNFGPDGLLYISTGDGGGADDENFDGLPPSGHGAIGNAQDPTSALGKILRINPQGNNSANGQYGIPEDNPFAARRGYVQEIYAYGFRNPFRFSFDFGTGELYAADVGQNKIEEIDEVVKGGNYGWNIKEGMFCFDSKGTAPGGVTDAAACGPLGLREPIAQYDHDEGIAVIGGFVYRGSQISPLLGRYVFGDYSRQFLGNNGRLFFLEKRNEVNKKEPAKPNTILEMRVTGQPSMTGVSVTGFGQDNGGELYLLGNMTGVLSGNTGFVRRLVRVP